MHENYKLDEQITIFIFFELSKQINVINSYTKFKASNLPKLYKCSCIKIRISISGVSPELNIKNIYLH